MWRCGFNPHSSPEVFFLRKKSWDLYTSATAMIDAKFVWRKSNSWAIPATDVFAIDENELGHTTVVQHSIMGDHPPIKQCLRCTPIVHREKVAQLLNDMLKQQVIQPSSAWASPVVLVPKKDGNLRFCVDYTKVNAGRIPPPKSWWHATYVGESQVFLNSWSGIWILADRDGSCNQGKVCLYYTLWFIWVPSDAIWSILLTCYISKTGGLVEKFNSTLTNMLAKSADKNSNWDAHLPFLLFACRATIQESVRESPFYLL